MEAVSPFSDAASLGLEVKVAEKQEQYNTLPAFYTRLGLLTRWRLSDEERQHIANGGDLMIALVTFGRKVQPIMPMADTPDNALAAVLAEEDRLCGGTSH